MRTSIAMLTTLAGFGLAACGGSEPPAAPKPASAAPAPAATPESGKAEAKAEVPDTHGMPGMADLFKSDEEKKAEKK